MYTVALPNAAIASALVRLTAGSSAASVWTTRMPRPPPPAAALIITGYLISRASLSTSFGSSGRAPTEPGTQGTPGSVGALPDDPKEVLKLAQGTDRTRHAGHPGLGHRDLRTHL